MPATRLAIRRTGLVSSVGLDAPSACAAIRAKITHPSETRFRDGLGEWLMGHAVPLAQPLRGLARLTELAAMALDECLADVPRDRWATLPVLLCVAEPERPGRETGLDDQLFAAIEARLDASFSDQSAVVAHGRVGTAVALAAAERLLQTGPCEEVVIVGVDSLLRWPTLGVYEAADRLLTPTNSDGFLPGECAGAVRVGRPGPGAELRCAAVGFAVEPAPLDSGRPLRGDGLSAAMQRALGDAGLPMHAMDHRIADLSGEQYYFKEATLALARTMRERKEFIDLWHPAECTGEIGAAAGLAMLAVMDAAHRKGYAPGPLTLAQFANDGGARAAVVLAHGGA